MADELIYPDFKRLQNRKSHAMYYGYDLSPRNLRDLLQEAIARVPPEYRESSTVYCPDEDDDEWGIRWFEPESDESYTARWRVHQETAAREAEDIARRNANILHRWKVITEDLDAATTRQDKVRLAKRLGVVENEARRYNVELPE